MGRDMSERSIFEKLMFLNSQGQLALMPDGPIYMIWEYGWELRAGLSPLETSEAERKIIERCREMDTKTRQILYHVARGGV